MDLQLISDPSEDLWEALVISSPQGTIFSTLNYLRSLGVTYTCYLVNTSTGKNLGGVAIIEDGRKMHPAPFSFTPYQGILFSKSVSDQPNHKRIAVEFRITEFIINSLLERYNSFSMAFACSFSDIRPFLWHNYYKPDGSHFKVKTRFTGVLNIQNFNLDDYLKTIRSVRRQEFSKNKAVISKSNEIEVLLSLYVKTFERQGLPVLDENLNLIRGITEAAIKNGYGRLSKSSVDGVIASMTLFLYDTKSAYYLFGASDPELRSHNSSSPLIIDNICKMSALGLPKIDFVGVNSPSRGDFKLSFNPKLQPYFEVDI